MEEDPYHYECTAGDRTCVVCKTMTESSFRDRRFQGKFYRHNNNLWTSSHKAKAWARARKSSKEETQSITSEVSIPQPQIIPLESVITDPTEADDEDGESDGSVVEVEVVPEDGYDQDYGIKSGQGVDNKTASSSPSPQPSTISMRASSPSPPNPSTPGTVSLNISSSAGQVKLLQMARELQAQRKKKSHRSKVAGEKLKVAHQKWSVRLKPLSPGQCTTLGVAGDRPPGAMHADRLLLKQAPWPRRFRRGQKPRARQPPVMVMPRRGPRAPWQRRRGQN